MSHEEITVAADNMVKELNLEECSHRMVGGSFLPQISGGERKRTSLGYELITDPRIILLDEPTSGLDSSNALQIVKLLKKETILRGCSIICTLHQPSSQLFKLFDRVICLSDGQTIYNGSVSDIKPYFMRQFNVEIPTFNNPSDFLIKLAIDPTLVKGTLSVQSLVTTC
jgi:ABC-type multidrug transport system ATPase subunit